MKTLNQTAVIIIAFLAVSFLCWQCDSSKAEANVFIPQEVTGAY